MSAAETTEPPAVDLLCRLRFEVRDWQEALCGEREGLDELCAEIDAKIEKMALRDGYECSSCAEPVPHDSSFCPHCSFGPPGQG